MQQSLFEVSVYQQLFLLTAKSAKERRETRRKDKSYKPEAASCKLFQQLLLVFSCNKSLFELQITTTL
jgi:hypothetical protein